MPVFFIHSTDVANGVVTITDTLLIHISKSLRAKPGDSLLFNDDQGHRYHTSITQITKKFLEAKIQHTEAPPLSTRPNLILAQAVLKGEKMGWVIQKATELGVSTIIPVISDRVILKLVGQQEETHRARWQRIALEAAQQSERWTLPRIAPLHTFQQLLESPRQEQPIFMAERNEGFSLLTVPLPKEEQASEVTVIIGPEGGWSPNEFEAAQSHNCVFASFGQQILRAETASLAALSVLQARLNGEEN